jgi:osmotically-inducible protein OsmY
MIEKTEVEGLLKNTASLIGCSIKVAISKAKLTLTGMVHTLDQKGEAERIAWKAIGVWVVNNEIVIELLPGLVEMTAETEPNHL